MRPLPEVESSAVIRQNNFMVFTVDGSFRVGDFGVRKRKTESFFRDFVHCFHKHICRGFELLRRCLK